MSKIEDRRLALQSIFESILGTRNVYFQPPESFKMHYPCIRYERSRIQPVHADNSIYKKDVAYDVIYIDEDPDSPIVEALLSLPYSSYSRHYVSDGLNHDVIQLYY